MDIDTIRNTTRVLSISKNDLTAPLTDSLATCIGVEGIGGGGIVRRLQLFPKALGSQLYPSLREPVPTRCKPQSGLLQYLQWQILSVDPQTMHSSWSIPQISPIARVDFLRQLEYTYLSGNASPDNHADLLGGCLICSKSVDEKPA